LEGVVTLYGAIEAGGTKFVCAIGNEQLKVVERVSFPTTTPEETLKQVFAFFDQFALKAIGIGSFGPIDLNPASNTYGYIKNTPKPLWKDFPFLGEVKNRYHIPVGWTTDVNAAALSEATIGAGKGLRSVLYLTVGTGIGGGAIVAGKILEGFSHPEMGHIMVQRHPMDHFEGICPFHRNCLEGMASGPSIEARVNRKGNELDPGHEIWDFLADYLAQALSAYTLMLRPEILILGGGVMKSPNLLLKTKSLLQELIHDYVEIPPMDRYVTSPKLGDDAGIMGGFILAKQELGI
jgi:fructokinase